MAPCTRLRCPRAARPRRSSRCARKRGRWGCCSTCRASGCTSAPAAAARWRCSPRARRSCCARSRSAAGPGESRSVPTGAVSLRRTGPRGRSRSSTPTPSRCSARCTPATDPGAWWPAPDALRRLTLRRRPETTVLVGLRLEAAVEPGALTRLLGVAEDPAALAAEARVVRERRGFDELVVGEVIGQLIDHARALVEIGELAAARHALLHVLDPGGGRIVVGRW